MIHYYLTVSPVEALIASQLTPEAFGCYMAVGYRKGSAEQLIFAEVEGGFGDYFDWEFAKEKCVSHPNGDPKCTSYLSIYRVLEHIPLQYMKSLFLTTQDGRTLELTKAEYVATEDWKGCALYKELCPITPLVASRLAPGDFAKYLVDDTHKIQLPAIMFADIRILEQNNLRDSGNVGTVSKMELDHIHDCLGQVALSGDKPTKTVDRSFCGKFTYQTIATGIYAADSSGIIFYPMPDAETLKRDNYDWGRSAYIL
ncbi:MAG: hypothetical protein WC340_07090 [Kiritimatiellia bacterium]